MGDVIEFPDKSGKNEKRVYSAIMLSAAETTVFAYPDGSVVVDGDVDEASLLFWEAVERRVRSSWSKTDLGEIARQLDETQAELKRIQKQKLKLDKKIKKLKEQGKR